MEMSLKNPVQLMYANKNVKKKKRQKIFWRSYPLIFRELSYQKEEQRRKKFTSGEDRHILKCMTLLLNHLNK
jgi:hypothetical protein